MKYLFVLVLCLALFRNSSFSQTYWQQEVNYNIAVTLDDESHYLHGFEEFVYINHSPDTLRYIYVHLWANAYSNGETALANQLYQDGENILKFVKEKDRGFIDSLNFKSNGTKLEWLIDEKHCDIAKINLPKPLSPGDKITIETPFRVKIPSGRISRLGHIGQSYQITQWYPKPAVYDKDGWHQMPYLNQGEFYSEFGAFEVSITLPQNYVVGATGDLQTASEHTFLDSIATATEQIIKDTLNNKKDTVSIPSSSKMKTIRYTQNKVHDFAWFADKKYLVLKGVVELPHSKKKVDLYAMFTPNNKKVWENAIEYIHDGAYYYSLWNGDYPYNQITAVDGTISAGGGMEYPNVTVIGNSYSKTELEIVIVHEVGHNWFYGILGTNERVHGWMDEGLNTLNEVRYFQTKYPDNTYLSNMIMGGSFNFHGLNYRDMNDLFTRTWMSIGADQPIETHSKSFTGINYGLVMYQKTGLVFDYLKYYLGDELFDKAMHHYYEKWKFKHPQPTDLKQAIEEVTDKNLDWVFDEIINTTHQIDYKIGCSKHKHHRTFVKVKNVGQVDGPIPVTAKNDSISITKWVEPGNLKSEITFDFEADIVRIDEQKQLPEVNRQNNQWKKSQLFNRIEPIKLNFPISYNRPEETNINYFPALGANAGDQFMIGAGIHNYSLAPHPFNYFIAPMYSFGRNNVSGITEISYAIQPKNKIKMIKYGLSLKSFATKGSLFTDLSGTFNVASPYINIFFRDETKRNPIKHTIHLQGLANNTQRGVEQLDELGNFTRYTMEYNERDHEFIFNGRQDFIYELNSADQMGRLTADATYRFRYLRNKKSAWIEMRLFGGYNFSYVVTPFSENDYRYRMTPSGSDGMQDIFVEDYFFDRNATSSLFTNQRMDNLGGFRSTSTFGNTNTWMTTANFYMDLPVPFAGVFADVGAVDLNGTVYGMYNTGLGIRIGKVFGIYFPLLTSDNLIQGMLSENYLDRIRFTLSMNFVNTGRFRRLIN